MPDTSGEQNNPRSAVPWAMASLVCSYASGFMQYLYGYYHWQVVFAFPPWKPPEYVRGPMFAIFGILQAHKILFAVGATVFAVICLRHGPRWIGVAVLVPAIILLFAAVFVVT